MQQQFNPYQAPANYPPQPYLPQMQPGLEGTRLASRMSRLGASLIDGIAVAVINLPLMLSLGLVDFGRTTMPTMGEQLVTGAIGLVVFILVQGYFLANGQTVGKRLLGLQMVDVNTNQPPGFGKLLGLRYVPTMLASLVPFVGGILSLIDALFIFREDQRCIHDHIAGTKVIDKPMG